MTKKEKYEERVALKRANRKPKKSEVLAAEGRKYYNFVFPIALFQLWAERVEASGEKPNERLLRLIKMDMQGGQ